MYSSLRASFKMADIVIQKAVRESGRVSESERRILFLSREEK